MSISRSDLLFTNLLSKKNNYYENNKRKEFFFLIKIWIERPLSFSTIIWDRKVDISTIKSSFATYQFFFPKSTFIECFEKSLKTASYYKINLETFDHYVKNHASLANFSSTELSKIPRLSSFAFLFTVEKISPIVIGLFKNSLVLLDGHHRSICSKITHSPIVAIILDFGNLKIPKHLLKLI